MSPPIIENNLYVKNVTVLVGGVTVMTQGTRCDGIINCYGAIDEKDCGSSTLDTFFIGKILYQKSYNPSSFLHNDKTYLD